MLTSKCINVEAEDWVKLKKISQKNGIPMSEIIREAIKNYIKKETQQTRITLSYKGDHDNEN